MYKFKGSGVAAPKTTPAAQLVTLQPTCAVATGTITVSAPTEKESRIALMVQLIPTLLEYLLMWLLTYSVTVKNAAGSLCSNY
jgi:hypothetical protein